MLEAIVVGVVVIFIGWAVKFFVEKYKPRFNKNIPGTIMQKYLRQLVDLNNNLQFSGIPDPKEKKDVPLPEVFVMQRAVESVPIEDYRQLMLEWVSTVTDSLPAGHVSGKLLSLAEDEKQAGDLRGSCAEALGSLGEKDKAAAILVSLYRVRTDKYDLEARQIYSSLWNLTAV